MGIGTQQDFKIYNEEFFGGMTEILMQNADTFNAASMNSVRLVPTRKRGDYEKESLMQSISGLVSRRDTTSVSAATDLKLEALESVGVKVNRKIGPVAQTLDAFRKISQDPRVFSFLLGQQTAQAVSVDYANSAVNALAAAIGNVGALVKDVTGQTVKTVTHGYLAGTLAKFGDNSKNIVCWVMHSKPYYDLVQQSISDKITNIADLTIVSGTAASLGRPTIVIDSPALIIAGTPDNYVTLGLVENSCEVSESEDREIVSDTVTGLENLVMRIQGEYAFNLKLKGYAWDVTNGGTNPVDAAIGTGSNWDKYSTDNKSTAGVYLLSE